MTASDACAYRLEMFEKLFAVRKSSSKRKHRRKFGQRTSCKANEEGKLRRVLSLVGVLPSTGSDRISAGGLEKLSFLLIYGVLISIEIRELPGYHQRFLRNTKSRRDSQIPELEAKTLKDFL